MEKDPKKKDSFDELDDVLQNSDFDKEMETTDLVAPHLIEFDLNYTSNKGDIKSKSGLSYPVFLSIKKATNEMYLSIGGNTESCVKVDLDLLSHLKSSIDGLIDIAAQYKNLTPAEVSDINDKSVKTTKFYKCEPTDEYIEACKNYTSGEDIDPETLVNGLNSLSVGSKKSKAINALKDLLTGMSKGSSSSAEDTTGSEETEKVDNVDNMLNNISEKAKEEEAKEEFDEMKNQMDDAQKAVEDMTEEEKKEFYKKQIEDSRKAESDRIKAFEQELLGHIESEPDVEYNFDHFKKIYSERGPEALKEELAKLPANERETIIKQIVEEFKQRKAKQ